MEQLRFNRYAPIVTGTPQIGGQTRANTQAEAATPSFQEILKQRLQSEVTFSKHAQSRVEQRGVQLTPNSMERLEEGVRIAKEKGLDDTLILVDSTAFLVSARNGRVITALGGGDLKGNIFTNIDGTVII
ncbi:MAG: flagellar protein [Provencibacterium sp.]|jgi:flagellar operon protein|nr:flagellar protein [Provencibacterium sp.]